MTATKVTTGSVGPLKTEQADLLRGPKWPKPLVDFEAHKTHEPGLSEGQTD